MTKAYEFMKALAVGEPPLAVFQISWGVHDGLRGTTWTSLTSDGKVLTNTIKPSRGPFVPQKPTQVGELSADEVRTFAAILCAQRFDLIQPPPPDPTLMGSAEVELVVAVPDDRFSLRCPSAQLSDVFGLAEIGRVFKELRARFVTG